MVGITTIFAKATEIATAGRNDPATRFFRNGIPQDQHVHGHSSHADLVQTGVEPSKQSVTVSVYVDKHGPGRWKQSEDQTKECSKHWRWEDALKRSDEFLSPRYSRHSGNWWTQYLRRGER